MKKYIKIFLMLFMLIAGNSLLKAQVTTLTSVQAKFNSQESSVLIVDLMGSGWQTGDMIKIEILPSENSPTVKAFFATVSKEDGIYKVILPNGEESNITGGRVKLTFTLDAMQRKNAKIIRAYCVSAKAKESPKVQVKL